MTEGVCEDWLKGILVSPLVILGTFFVSGGMAEIMGRIFGM